MLTDIGGSRVLDFGPERTEAAAEAVLQTLTVQQRQEVEAVVADMRSAYANAVASQNPNAEVVHDKFHVAKHLGDAVDQVRRADNKALMAEDDDRLKGTRQLWLFNAANLSPAQRHRFAAINQDGLKTARAWAIREEFRWFWRYVYPMSADEFFSQCYAWGVRCRLRPVIKVAKMLKRQPGAQVRSPWLPVVPELQDPHPVLLREARRHAVATLPVQFRKSQKV